LWQAEWMLEAVCLEIDHSFMIFFRC